LKKLSNSIKDSFMNIVFVKDRTQTKISRIVFLIINMLNQFISFLCVAFGLLIYNLNGAGLVYGYLILILPLWIGVHSIIYRLNDIGNNRWLTLLMFVPIINFGFFLYLLFVPGKSVSK